MRTPNGRARQRDRAGDVAERDEAERLAHEPRELQELRAPFLPAALAHHLVLHDEPPERGQDQHHRVIGHFLDEGVRHVGDRDAARRRGRHVDRVDADAAERDDLALLEPVDHALGDRAALRVEGVAVARRHDEFIFSSRGNLHDVDLERAEPFHLEIVGGSGCAITGSCRRCDLELGHTLLLEKMCCGTIRCGTGRGTPGGSGTDWRRADRAPSMSPVLSAVRSASLRSWPARSSSVSSRT